MIEPLLPHDAAPSLSSKMLRQFAGLWILFFGALAAWQGYVRGNETAALALAGVGLMVGLAGLVWPPAIRPVFKGALAIAHPIGRVISWLLLTLVYFVVITPIGLVMRLVGRDALGLRRPEGRESYLRPRPAPAGTRSYFRQS